MHDPGCGQKRLLYPHLKVVVEDYDRDCYVVSPSRATTSKSHDILSAFRRAKGEWTPCRIPSRLQSHSMEFEKDQVTNKFSRSKTALGIMRPRRQPKAGVDPELAIRPLTHAQTTVAGIRVRGSSATTPTSLTMSLFLSDGRRPPTGVRGRTRESRRGSQYAVQHEDSHPFLENWQQRVTNYSFPGEKETLVMQRHLSSLRHPETYARWVQSLRHTMQHIVSQSDAPGKREGGTLGRQRRLSMAEQYQETVGLLRDPSKTAGQFEESLSGFSHEVLAAVQMQLDYVRSEVAGLSVEGASILEGFAGKYGQRKLELAMLRKHLNDEHWNISSTADLDCSLEGFKVWLNGLTVKRLSLRHNAQVQRAILPFFNALKNPMGQITKKMYMTFNLKVFRALLPLFDARQAMLLSEHDWKIDSASTEEVENPFINESQNFVSVFELADNWCEHPDAGRMVTWLNKLRVTIFDSDGDFLKDEKIVHDERFWFDGIDPLGPNTFQKWQSLESRGTRNINFEVIREQISQNENQNKRAALSTIHKASSSRPKASAHGYCALGKTQHQQTEDRPRRREAFNVKLGSRRVSLTQTYAGEELPVRSYLNNMRIPNIWAAELKQLASAYLQQAKDEHAAAAAALDLRNGEFTNYPAEGASEKWADSDHDQQLSRQQASAEVSAVTEEYGDDNECGAGSTFHPGSLAVEEPESGDYVEANITEEDEAGLTLRPEFFDDGEKVGDVSKLYRLRDIIFGRAETPGDIVEMSMKLGLQNLDAPIGSSTAQTSPVMEHRENWLKTYRWAHVNKPTKRDWERFKAARFKERQDAYNRMRSGRSLALESYFETSPEDQAPIFGPKSFSERWEEREEKRQLAAVAEFKTRHIRGFDKRKMSADVARRIAEISEVLDGTSRGTFHGATPGQRPITATFAVDGTSSGMVNGLQFPDANDTVELEPDIDVSKIVESRLSRMGISTPLSGSSSRQRRSRPGTSSSLFYIDETRDNMVDEPILGWSSGIPAPVSTPSDDNSGYLAPGDLTPNGSTWKRVQTPKTFSLGAFSPVASPGLVPASPVQAAAPFAPALSPLKEGRERLSRESRKTASTTGQELGSVLSRLIEPPITPTNPGSSKQHLDELGMWGDDQKEQSPLQMEKFLSSLTSTGSKSKKRAKEDSVETYVGRTPSELAFQEKQQQFKADWDRLRYLSGDAADDSSDDEVMLPALTKGKHWARKAKFKGGQ